MDPAERGGDRRLLRWDDTGELIQQLQRFPCKSTAVARAAAFAAAIGLRPVGLSARGHSWRYRQPLVEKI
jgi:hypothetical protein